MINSKLKLFANRYVHFTQNQKFVFSTPKERIGIFNSIGGYNVLLWGKSLVDNSTHLVQVDQRDFVLQPWNSFMPFNIPADQLAGATSYSYPTMNNLTVIELNSAVLVLDLTTKSLSSKFRVNFPNKLTYIAPWLN